MAKHKATVAVAAAAAAVPQIPIIKVKMADELKVIVDVNEMTIPYTVGFNDGTLFKGLVDRAEIVPAVLGSRTLGWGFAHTQKDWKHVIGYSINGAAEKVLESKSEAKKDSDHSLGFAIVERT